MKTHLLIAALLVVSLFSSAQTEEKKDKLSRKERKELRKIEKEETRKKVTKLIEGKQYVLKANYLKNPYGSYLSVDDTRNFIWVDSVLSVVQFSSFRTIAAGGEVGVTVEGKVFDYEQYVKGKSNSTFIRFNINSLKGNYWVVIDVRPNGKADAEVYSPNGKRMDFSGKLVSIDEAGVLKGKGY
ncbi:MAG: hypothetical protein CVU09_10230 [Bacteroidetes bacterium HGW-Bacteroidetes-4]|jgi:hypothetical protein|nr:MAG: hypothetical protein CVU09_10230 [Bacteroidetes bacterium HGW-Bacteroidetes-4]